MTELLENALRKVATLPQGEQDASASQILETLEDEAAWKEKLARTQGKLQGLAADFAPKTRNFSLPADSN